MSAQDTARAMLERNGFKYESVASWGFIIRGRYYNPNEAMCYVMDLVCTAPRRVTK